MNDKNKDELLEFLKSICPERFQQNKKKVKDAGI